MKCLNCGTELEEDKLYCPKCGYEIQLVPDFEPEIEEKVTGALEGITSHLIEREQQEKKKKRLERKARKSGKIRFYSALAAAILVAALAVGFFVFRSMGSLETQLTKAQENAEEKKYDKAIEYMSRAVELDGSNMDIRNKLGEYYILNGQTEHAASLFREIIDIDRENEDAYRYLIGIYEKAQDYETINTLIRSSGSERIMNTFTKYIANPPQFSYPQGTYEEIIPLKLTTNTTGKVYYTLDGSEPDEKSRVYQNSILLDDGIYTVRAYFVNEFGIRSETAVQIYQIHLSRAHEPEVMPESGEYSQPQMISVTVPEGESVYYTVDGSKPTKDSIPYNNPIAMPIGGSSYQFISYTEDGAASEVVRRDYAFAFQSTLDIQGAMNLLLVGLIDKGIIADTNCSVPDRGGRNLYVCSSAISINQKNYFLMIEYYEDPTGVNTRTGNMYCVDADTGGLYTAALDEDGHYSVVSF